MVKFFGNCNCIDWGFLLSSLQAVEGKSITLDISNFNSNDHRYVDIFNKLQNAKFNPYSAKWINYYPNIHYSSTIDEKISNWLGLTGVHRSWISRLDPGFYAPWHWDVDDNETEYLKKGSIKRFSGFIDTKETSMAHVFTIEKDSICNTDQGDFYQWGNHDAWHAGMNGGLYPKFMYHVLGW